MKQWIQIKNPLKCLLRKNKKSPSFYIHCFIIGWHICIYSYKFCNIVSILFKQIQVKGTLRGGGQASLKPLYLNDSADLDSTIFI